MLNPARYFFRWIGVRLAGRGIIDGRRGERIADLTWPRFLTMFARRSQRVADIAMVGVALGPAAIAGLAFATIYWRLANGFALGLIGGTINQVSQRFGAGRYDELDLAVMQSVWVGIVLVVPFLVVYSIFSGPLVSVFTKNSIVIRHGQEYLSVISIALLFAMLNLIASRTLAGADNTRIPMFVRATGAFANIVFNAVFIFGLGMGAAGAALGTVLAEALTTATFAWGLLSGSLPIIGRFPVTLSVRPPYFDRQLTKHLLTITPPLMTLNIGKSIAQFPLFVLLAMFGPTVVAAYEIGRRVRQLLGAFGAAFSTSASSLVGQALGRGNETTAVHYGWDTVKFSGIIYLASLVLVFVFATPIASLFADDPTVITETVPFVRIAALSFVGYGLNQAFEGILKAAGDNSWSMYGRLFGLYFALLPLVYIGTVTSLGVIAIYLAIIAETWSNALITGFRVSSGAWKEISRSYRPEVPTD